MQKKMFLVLIGLLLLVSFPTSQTFGAEKKANKPHKVNVATEEDIEEEDGAQSVMAFAASATDSVGGGWSAPIYHPEIGDKIVSVNNQRVRSEAEFRRAVRNSSREIVLGVIDQRTGNFYHLRTMLWSPYNQTRLGIYIETSRNYNGVIVTGFVPNCPGMHCQYLRGETRPVYDGLYRNGGWYDDYDYDGDVYWYEY